MALTPVTLPGDPPAQVQAKVGSDDLDLSGASMDVTGTRAYQKTADDTLTFDAVYNQSLVSIAVSGAKVAGRAFEDFKFTASGLKINYNPPPPLNQPVISGQNELRAEAGFVGALEVAVTLDNASVSGGAPLLIRCEVVGESQAVAAEAEATANGDMAIAFEAGALDDLAPGVYALKASSAGNGFNYAVAATEVGQLTIANAAPGGFSMPEKFKATKGFSYQLIEGVPTGRPLPAIEPKSGKKKVATIGADGVLTALKAGKTTVTVKGSKEKCVVTVVKNQLTAKAPKPGKGSGMHASLKKLSYNKKGELAVNLHLMNRTGAQFKSAEGLTLTIARGETVLYQGPFAIDRKKPLGAGKNGTYELVLTDESLKGLDLPNAGLTVSVTGWTDAKLVFEDEGTGDEVTEDGGTASGGQGT